MFSLKDGSPLSEFLAKATPLSVAERGSILANAKELQEMSDATASAGETEGAGTNDANDSHFITFVYFKGKLYELDGRTFDENGLAYPVVHCDTTPENWVMDAAKVIREDFMARDPDNPMFNVTALCKLDGAD